MSTEVRLEDTTENTSRRALTSGGQGVAGSNPVSPTEVFSRQRPVTREELPASVIPRASVGTILGTIPLEHLLYFGLRSPSTAVSRREAER